jgi:hypothetical protein
MLTFKIPGAEESRGISYDDYLELLQSENHDEL